MQHLCGVQYVVFMQSNMWVSLSERNYFMKIPCIEEGMPPRVLTINISAYFVSGWGYTYIVLIHIYVVISVMEVMEDMEVMEVMEVMNVSFCT